MPIEVLKSEIDASVNFVERLSEGQALEARYVRRHADYVACYISSQTACAQSCRFCHLTATGQNQARDATEYEMRSQADQVLRHYETQKHLAPAKFLHYNFMARGEPLESNLIRGYFWELHRKLADTAFCYNLYPRFLISTIMPESLDKSLIEVFPTVHPEIYYSLYSLRPEFRRRWLPRAMDPYRALDLLTEWQRFTKKIVSIHYALIAGENDSPEEAYDICHELKKRGLRADFTLVRYNSPNERTGVESPNYERYTQWLREGFPESRVKTITRVGEDVAASCGMFINVK